MKQMIAFGNRHFFVLLCDGTLRLPHQGSRFRGNDGVGVFCGGYFFCVG